jgi:hypothetical protein
MWYKNVRAQNLLILAFSFIGLMGSVYVFNLKLEINQEDRRQIETTVFRSMVDYLTFHPKTDFDYIFLGVSGSDPSPEVLNNFQDHRPRVEPISSSKVTFGFSAPVIHKSDATQRGIQIDLESLDRDANGDIKVRMSLYQDRAASATYVYILNEFQGRYRVVTVAFPDSPIF